mmetsp:Transcript_1904/g.3457  ORF Transcript_1904/g.3457 Transcript_1904/m.3457 type:complete len:163 (-) Transcript_1904:1124-1612(-)
MRKTSPGSIATTSTKKKLGKIILALKQEKVIIAGDFNAWLTDYGAKKENDRGEELHDTIIGMAGCRIANRKNQSTNVTEGIARTGQIDYILTANIPGDQTATAVENSIGRDKTTFITSKHDLARLKSEAAAIIPHLLDDLTITNSDQVYKKVGIKNCINVGS